MPSKPVRTRERIVRLILVFRPAAILPAVLCAACERPLTDDQSELQDLEAAYVRAWVENDSAAVMALLTRDAVLLPGRTEPVVGLQAIRGFCFPDGPATKITKYSTTIDEILYHGELAVIRGRGELAFEWQPVGDTLQRRHQRSVFVSVARRAEAGRWRIARRMWSDLPEE